MPANFTVVVGTASALGRVFGRPLQTKETIPCSPQNCSQLQKELQIQQAQSPSHIFQQQCSIHKRFRLFRQRPRKCPVHGSPSAPNYILSPTSVHPLVVSPDKIIADHDPEPITSQSWRPLSSSVSASSRLTSSTVSLALSSSSCTQGSDTESCTSSTATSQPAKNKKKYKRLFKREQQQQLRCLCYLDTSLDQKQHKPELRNQSKARPQPQLTMASWYPQNHQQKEAGRLRRIWNDSTIFHWSKPSGMSRRSQQQQQEQQQQSALHGRAQSSYEHRRHLQAPESGVPMRNSLSGTDISDEGNHSLSDVEDDDDNESYRTTSTSLDGSSHHRVSFHECSGLPAATEQQTKDDFKAIARHQAEMTLCGMSEAAMRQKETRPPVASFAKDDDGDDDDEDWDIQSDSGAPSSSPMYSAGAREPASYSTVTLPLSPPTRDYSKKASSANLNSLRSRQRCLSLPADGLSKLSSTPSENWDADFDIASAVINVPTQVADKQMSLQMDIDNIKDFANQIEHLKTIHTSLRIASSSLKATDPKKHQDLSMLFQRDWEQAEVIIDLGEIAQTSNTTSGNPGLAAGPLSLLSGRGPEQSIGRISGRSITGSAGSRPKRPPLATTMDSGVYSGSSSTISTTNTSFMAKSRSVSQSSNITGTTIAVSPSGGDSEADVPMCLSSRTPSGLTIETDGPDSSYDKLKQHQSSSKQMKESCSSPASLGQCNTPMTPLPQYLRDEDEDDDYELDGINSPILECSPFDDELRSKWQHHGKEDSSATVKAAPVVSVTSVCNPTPGPGGVQTEIEASFRHYQKYSHRTKKSSSSRYLFGHREADEYEDGEDDDEDDGYESYGYGQGDGTSVGVITPIPSDRHMQVLKDILMEELGTDVARQYMFKHGEQDHIRFSVEVIPGLLKHLEGLQQRLGKQLMVLRQPTVLV
ncbi:hypothetical protein BGZ50_006336 [Haplosporangium sp. Z 11]|nr:hypothetical protein BGZ50_006336 [Haplosporangium sp. Z 11]